MINKRDAELFSEELLKAAKSERPKDIAILKRNPSMVALLAILPTILSPVLNVGMRNSPLSVYAQYGSLGIFSLLLLMIIVHIFYYKRTPLLQIDPNWLTYYGYWPWSKTVIPLAKIGRVAFVTRPTVTGFDFLRVTYQDGEKKIRIPSNRPSQIPKMRELLKIHFSDCYVEVYE